MLNVSLGCVSPAHDVTGSAAPVQRVGSPNAKAVSCLIGFGLVHRRKLFTRQQACPGAPGVASRRGSPALGGFGHELAE